MYGILYSLARITAEFFRQPDIQLGFLYGDWLTMGMLQSGIFAILSVIVLVLIKKNKKTI
jgi:phosphatidylglycerol:prolipoprotein diacylglycerol transferase